MKNRNNSKPIRMWKGTLILRCPPCTWNKCIYCGFSNDSLAYTQPTVDDLLGQLDYYLKRHGDRKNLEIYNSGSFFDNKQILPEARIEIFKQLSRAGIDDITIESRPEFITEERIEAAKKNFKGDITVSMGLEVADDSILRKQNKGFTLDDIEESLFILKDMGIYSLAYLLAGLPYVKDHQKSVLNSINYVKDIGFSEIYLMATRPKKKTEGYQLWKEKKWFPIKKYEFKRIVKLAQEIEPEIEYSFRYA